MRWRRNKRLASLGARVGAPRPTRWVRWGYLRGLGLLYLVAFTSLAVQLRGLYGARGIEPIEPLVDRLRPRLGRDRWWRAPTLFWFGASDRALVRAVRAGQLASALLALNVAPFPSALAAWALYTSFLTAGGDFLGFQWDALLVETGAHALLVAPFGLRPGLAGDLPWHARWLLRAFAFRFHFEAGLAKVRSGDETWRERTALRYHYETQPLPTPLGWYAHHLPPEWNVRATRLALATELYAPFLGLLARPLRWLAFALESGLMLGIALTGNYGFFNPLAVLVALPLLDDGPLAKRGPLPPGRRFPFLRHARIPFETALFALGALELYGRLRPLPAWARKVLRRTLPFHLPSSYGLFANMTLTRPEVVIEGTDDGEHWREYVFRYKPGPLANRPRWVAPHQPRLDWQMWFAALTPPPPWFLALLVRLLEGSPDVKRLFAEVPFAKPQAVRARLYDYRMTDLETRARTGAWWERKLLGEYFPAIALQRREEPAPPPA